MDKIRQGSTNRDSVIMLQELLQLAGHKISVDGGFGKGTDAAVKAYQEKHGLLVDGVVGDKTWMLLFSQFPDYLKERVEKHLSEEDVQEVADQLGVELAVVKAVNEVESGGLGFAGGKPKILFEGHVFWKRLKAHGVDPSTHREGNETILFPKTTAETRKHYRGDQHDRLDQAKKIHEDAALESASWGLFQIMGYHWKALEYPSVKNFVGLMHKNEGEHLKAFGRFVMDNKKMHAALKAKDWAGFAERYNGPGYKTNKYDIKLASAYAKHSAAT